MLGQSIKASVDEGYLSIAEPIEFPSEDGLTAYAFFYRPKNRDYAAPQGELPPLLVESHGGPTGMTYSELNLEIQNWTNRGKHVLSLNFCARTPRVRAHSPPPAPPQSPFSTYSPP